MNKLASGVLFAFLLAANISAVGAAQPPQPGRDILGIKVGMSAEVARGRLEKIGSFQKKERKGYEVWEVRDRYFTHLMIQFKSGLVHGVTAVAHQDAKRERMRYGDVAELKKARQAGEVARKNYRYEWVLEAAGRDPKINVVAWGRDPQYLQYYSIERVN